MPVLGRGGHDIKERPARRISHARLLLAKYTRPNSLRGRCVELCAQPAECIPSLRFQTSACRSCSKQTRTPMTPEKNNKTTHIQRRRKTLKKEVVEPDGIEP